MDLVRSADELDRLRRACAEAHAVAVETLHWPPPPTEYPCLAAYAVHGGTRVLACYVYREDARRLCDAAAAPAAAPRFVMPQEWRDYFDRIVAIAMANVDFLVGVGICTRAAFEAKVVAMQAMLDQDTSERKDLERCLRALEA